MTSKTEFNQLGEYRNDEDPNIPPIRVKKRPLVSLDPTTGKYTFISEDETLQSTALVLPDTQSTNPFKRWKAYRSIAAAKREEKRREQNRKREALIDDTKNKIYSVVDSITILGKTVQTIPQRIEETIEDIENKVQTTNEKVQTTIETIQAIPARIQDTAREIQDAIDETKRITSTVIQGIQNIPQTIEENIKSTQMSKQKTKDDALKIKAQVSRFIFQSNRPQSISNLDLLYNVEKESNRKTVMTLADVDTSLDKMVSEALKLASEALTSAAELEKK